MIGLALAGCSAALDLPKSEFLSELDAGLPKGLPPPPGPAPDATIVFDRDASPTTDGGTTKTSTSYLPSDYQGGVEAFFNAFSTALNGGPGAVPGLGWNAPGPLPDFLPGMFCDNSSLNPGQTVADVLGLRDLTFPRSGCHPSLADAQVICDATFRFYNLVISLNTPRPYNCLDPTLPENRWLTTLGPPDCNPAQLANGLDLCGDCDPPWSLPGPPGPATVFHDTCVCDSNQPGC